MKKGAQKAKPVTKVITVTASGPRTRPRLSRGRKDRVKWKNTDTVGIRIKFLKKWPFTGSRHQIPVGAGGNSATLTVSSTAEKRKYRYTIVPKRLGKRGPPDPPGVSVGG